MSKDTIKLFRITVLSLFLVAGVSLSLSYYLFQRGSNIQNNKEMKRNFEKTSAELKESFSKTQNFKYFELSNSLQKLQKLLKDIKFLGNKSDLEKTEKSLGEKLSELKQSVKTSPEEVKKVWSNYSSQIKSFYVFVNNNNWQTLSRTSNRIYSRTPKDFNFSKDINYLLGVNLKDLNLIKDVTQKSTLESNAKSQIYSMADKLIALTNLLVDKNSEISVIRNNFILLKKELKEWVSQWDQSYRNKTFTSLEQNQFVSGSIFWTFFCITILFFSAFAYLVRLVFYKLEEQVDKRIIIALDNIVVQDNLNFIKTKKENFKSAVKTLNDYIKRKMSFGQIFQQTIPVPCLMLDENLSFKWFNTAFARDFNSNEDRESLNWDGLKKLLDITDEDPILESLRGQIPGIYDVQTSTNCKYQMYVNPIEYNNSNYILVFFFDLSAFSDSLRIDQNISDQTLNKIFTFFQETKFSEKLPSKLKEEFKLLGLEKSFDLFQELRANIYDQFLESKEEFTKVNEIAGKLTNKQSELAVLFDAKKNELIGLRSNFKDLKNVLIKIINNYSLAKSRDHDLLNDLKLCTSKFIGVKNDLEAKGQVEDKLIQWGIPSLIEFKKELKVAKESLRRGKPIEVSVLTNIDLFLSKFQMLLEDLQKNNDNLELSSFVDELLQLNSNISEHSANSDKTQRNIDILEEQMVLLLKSFYGHVKSIEEFSHFRIVESEVLEVNAPLN
jgi:hypothetical protein